MVVNPGPLSKRKGPGTYAQLAIHPRDLTTEERDCERTNGEVVAHKVFDRARAEIVRI